MARMENRLGDVWLQRNEHWAIRELAKNPADKHRVLGRSNSKSVHEYNRLTKFVRSDRRHTDKVPAQWNENDIAMTFVPFNSLKLSKLSTNHAIFPLEERPEHKVGRCSHNIANRRTTDNVQGIQS